MTVPITLHMRSACCGVQRCCGFVAIVKFVFAQVFADARDLTHSNPCRFTSRPDLSSMLSMHTGAPGLSSVPFAGLQVSTTAHAQNPPSATKLLSNHGIKNSFSALNCFCRSECRMQRQSLLQKLPHRLRHQSVLAPTALPHTRHTKPIQGRSSARRQRLDSALSRAHGSHSHFKIHF